MHDMFWYHYMFDQRFSAKKGHFVDKQQFITTCEVFIQNLDR